MGACIGAKLIFQCRDGHRHCGAAFIPLGRLPVLKGGIHFNGAPVGVDGRHVSPGAPIGDWGGINFTEPWNSFRYALFGESYDMVMRLFLNEHYEGYIYAMECT